MAKPFSLKSYAQSLVPSKAELEYLNSDAYKERCQRLSAELSAEAKERFANISKFLSNIPKDSFEKIRQKIEKECAEIIESTKHYAESQKWIKPKDVDELAGFYWWLHNRDEMNFDDDNIRIIKLFHEYKLKILNDQADIEKQAQKSEFKTWKDLVQVAFHKRVEDIEECIHDKVTNWKNGKGKIECAAYCRLIYDNNYFEKESTKVVAPVLYASMKFKIDINNQLQASKKDSLKRHIKLLARLFK